MSPDPEKTKGKDQPHRRLLRMFALIFGTPIAFLLFLNVILGGVPWPKEPVISPPSPSSGLPFEPAFKSENPSGLFDLHGLAVTCVLKCFRSVGPTGSTMSVRPGGSITYRAAGPNHLSARDAQPFVCSLRQLGIVDGANATASNRLLNAQLVLGAEYDDARFLWLKRKSSTPQIFSLDTAAVPPRWVQGDLPGACAF